VRELFDVVYLIVEKEARPIMLISEAFKFTFVKMQIYFEISDRSRKKVEFRKLFDELQMTVLPPLYRIAEQSTGYPRLIG
jgi:hypothetical protein